MAPKIKSHENSLFYIEAGIDLIGRKIMLDYDIDEDSVGIVIRALHKMSESSSAPIGLIINSQGGEIGAGMALYDTIKLLQQNGIDIITYGLGRVCSMSLIIFLAGKERISYLNTRFMHHQASTDLGQSDVESMKNNLKEIEIIDKVCNDIVIHNSRKSRKFWEEQIKGKEFWFSADEGMRFGIVTAIIGK